MDSANFVDKKSYDQLLDDREQRIQYAESLKQALAEKDKAYQQLIAQRDKLAEDLATTKAWKDDWQLEVIAHHKTQEEYNTLMEKAVRFAQSIYDPNVIDNDPIYVEAKAFLRERDLEADPFGATMKQFYKEREGT